MMSRRILRLGAIGVLGAGLALAAVIHARYPWIWACAADQFLPSAEATHQGPTHVMFTFVDHFEPHDQPTMDRWVDSYPAMARKHRDADGRMPQHSWFWFFAESDGEESLRFLQQLAKLSYDGFGEVELHLHHDNDTEPTFLEKITRMIRLSNWTGALVTAEPTPRTTFGFIHGLWALDNSRHGVACGINNELILLRRLGCYADFTHPSWGPMHPRQINQLYYATDDPQQPKSYDTGERMRVGGNAVGDLLIFEGPSLLRFRKPPLWYDHGDITAIEPPTTQRIDSWVRAGIHVEGKPEWVFVKVYTHGATPRDHEAVLGGLADEMHTYLERRYNDGKRYALHYVTAREAYNIAKAAEAGQTGDPNDYRDFAIPPYANRSVLASVPYDLIRADRQRIVARLLAPAGSTVDVTLRSRDVRVSGDVSVGSRRITAQGTTLALTVSGEGLVEFDLRPTALATEPGAPQ